MRDDNLDSITLPSPYSTQSIPRSVVNTSFNNIPNSAIAPMYQRVTPRQISTGMQRGEQTLSGTMMVISADGLQRILIGTGPNGEFGMFSCTMDTGDPNQLTMVWKRVGSTAYDYDPTTGKNRIQTGKLPDGTYDIAISNTGQNVADAF